MKGGGRPGVFGAEGVRASSGSMGEHMASAVKKWRAHFVLTILDGAAAFVLWWVCQQVGSIMRLDGPELPEIQFGSLTAMLVIVWVLPYLHAVAIFEWLGLHRQFQKVWEVVKCSVVPAAVLAFGSGFVLQYVVESRLYELGYEPCEARTFYGRFGSSEVYMPAPVPLDCWE